jgi:anaerobic dimethyl sulfoxide reductase subunit B (iron-sulfur subunit)
MRKGFIFNSDRCVNCKACSAACLLENEWSVSARKVFTYNSDLIPYIPVINLSLACNHCKKPLCLDGCPAGAFYRDNSSSAIVIETDKCIGCSYCTWNCPYDAPKLNVNKGSIEKCNFCYLRINEGVEPGCTSSCPTGALRYGDIPEIAVDNNLAWIPDKSLNPAVHIISSSNQRPLRIIPEPEIGELRNESLSPGRNISGEWSLILFSFLIVISVSLNISKLLGGGSVDNLSTITLLILAGLFSLLHLRIKYKAFRAILNIKGSPLSREIALFSIYSLFTFSTLVIDNTTLLSVSVVIGLLLLMVIDSVYTFVDRSLFMIFHSGQTFLTGLIVSSYLLQAVFPFIFIASVKILFSLYCLGRNKPVKVFFVLRIIRVAFLLIISVTLISGIEGNDTVKFIIFLSGEFADRILYYADFNPVNINSEISNAILSDYEKKRDK